MGAVSAFTRNACRPGAKFARCPPSAAGHKPSAGETRVDPGRSLCTVKSPSPFQTRSPDSATPHGKGRFS